MISMFRQDRDQGNTIQQLLMDTRIFPLLSTIEPSASIKRALIQFVGSTGLQDCAAGTFHRIVADFSLKVISTEDGLNLWDRKLWMTIHLMPQTMKK